MLFSRGRNRNRSAQIPGKEVQTLVLDGRNAYELGAMFKAIIGEDVSLL